jgi:hypothetical protein
MSVDNKVRERILRIVGDIRRAAAKHNINHGYLPTATIHAFPAKRVAPKSAEPPQPATKLHPMLPKPHTSIW